MNEAENKYLSLKTVAELYGYTRDHLGLMIRQRKLKGIKLGSYYVTTNGWMIDYIKNFADSNHPTYKNKLSNRFLTEILSTGKKIKSSPRSDLEKEISKELSQLSSLGQTSAKPENNFKNYEFKIVPERSFIILPVRKMDISEKKEILKRTEL